MVAAEATGVVVETTGDEGRATFDADVSLQGLGHWTYHGAVDLVKGDGGWGIHYTLGVAAPGRGRGTAADRARASRASGPSIVAQGGQPLAVGGPGEQARLDGVAGPLLGGLAGARRRRGGPQLGLEYAAGDLAGADGVEAGYEGQLGRTAVGGGPARWTPAGPWSTTWPSSREGGPIRST